MRGKLASQLESDGRGSSRTRAILLESKENLGAPWAKLVLETLKGLGEKANQIDFYGKQSRRKFDKRIAALKNLDEVSEIYLPGADAPTRAKIYELLVASYKGLADKVLSSPVPENLSPEAAAQVKSSLAVLADPFQKRAEAYGHLAQEARDKITVAPAPTAAASVKEDKAAPKEEISVTALLAAMQTKPSEPETVMGLKKYYEQQGNVRLASYFEGRLRQLNKKESN